MYRLVWKANSAWLLKVEGSFLRLQSHRVDKMALLFRINQETGQAIGLFRRTTLAEIGISIEDLTAKPEAP